MTLVTSIPKLRHSSVGKGISKMAAFLEDLTPGRSFVFTVLTGSVMIATSAAGLGWVLSNYINSSRLTTQATMQDAIDRSQAAMQASIGSLISRLSADEAKIAADEMRLGYVEKDDSDRYAATSAWEAKMDSQNAIILQGLADLKVQLAGKQNVKVR